jgi:dinuclear metal center YbgI/SA1388 family protein
VTSEEGVTTPSSRPFAYPHLESGVRMARRDQVVEYANELLALDAFKDYGPMGIQVPGAAEVRKIACGVSASRELFERAASRGAQLVIVHHGLFWNSEPRVVDERMKGRLKALFDADLTLAAYHLALDAHPELGNNALLARELGVSVESPFAGVGVGGRLEAPTSVESFAERIHEVLDREPLVFAYGPESIERVAVVTGGGGGYLADAAHEGYDLFLTGEPQEPSIYTARELGIHFVAAGHDATERLGVQALAAHLADRFGLEWEFVELPNPV